MEERYTEKDISFMRRAIELARQGAGRVNPNPLVGAVIVKDGIIIGEGYHRRFGDLHAERDAISHLTESADGADLYVTLEPCCHYGKQPPCVDAIIECGIKRVYCGSDDPNEKVAGGGFKRLRDAGIEVITHVLKEETDSLNDVFFHYIVNKTPYVVMKYAMTMDGKIATQTGESKWITNEISRNYVQSLRNALPGIMVGIGTVIQDDPMLDCRIKDGRNPIRIICDSSLRLPTNSRIVQSADRIKTIAVSAVPVQNDSGKIFCRQQNESGKTFFRNQNDEKEYRIRKERLQSAGVNVIETASADGQVNLTGLMDILGKDGIDGILLEGGGRLNYSAISACIVQEALVFVAPKVFGGSGKYNPVTGGGITSPDDAYAFNLVDMIRFEDDIMLRYRKVSE